MSRRQILAGVTAVSIGGRALLLRGPAGAGKSTLALALIDRGASLIGDDGVTLSYEHARAIASPPPNIAGKFEIRNVGIVDMATVSAPLCLILELAHDAPRFVDRAGSEEICGAVVPSLAFDPAIAQAPLRAEWALRRYGLAI